MSSQYNPPRPPTAPSGVAEVTDQVQVTEADAKGAVVRGYRVHFTTTKGARGSVFVPEAMYNVANVRAAVARVAGELDAVHGMQV